MEQGTISYFQITDAGIEKTPGIFISRLLPGGLAESTGLLSVGDEVLEVNNISIEGMYGGAGIQILYLISPKTYLYTCALKYLLPACSYNGNYETNEHTHTSYTSTY